MDSSREDFSYLEFWIAKVTYRKKYSIYLKK